MGKYFIGDAGKSIMGASGVFPIRGLEGLSCNEIDTDKAGRAFAAGLTQGDRDFLLNRGDSSDRPVRRGDGIENGSFLFNRSLEIFRAAPYEVQYAELKFRKVLDVINEGGPGALKYTSEVYDFFGKASLINAGLSKDISLVAGGGKEIQFPIARWGIGASWTIQELQAFAIAQKNGRGKMSPEMIRQRAALRGIEQSLNDQFFFGVPEVGGFGFINNPLVPTGPAATGATSSATNWESKTPDEVLADINAIGNVIYSGSLMVEMPDHLALPPAKLQYLHNTRISNYATDTLYSFILKNNQWFNKEESFVDLNELTGAGFGGTGKMVAYHKDVYRAHCAISMEPQSLPVQQNMFSYLMLWMAESAGCCIYHPRSMAYMEGI